MPATSAGMRGDPISLEHGLCRSLNGNDLERVHVAVLVADGDILSRTERMRTETIPGLIVLHGAAVVVEYPARVLGSARLVHQVSMFLLAVPKPPHTAVFTMLVPLCRVDMSGCVERRNEFITMSRGPRRELLRPREIQTDALERGGQLGHRKSPPFGSPIQSNSDYVDVLLGASSLSPDLI